MEQYKKRIADDILTRKLRGKGAVLIQGPKWCGKTTTAKQQAASSLFMSDNLEQNIKLANLNPGLLLAGESPRLIDEWQVAPQLWDSVRMEVDRRSAMGQFVLTGSAVPADTSNIFHTGTGRFAWLTMRTMSLWESGESNGSVSLKELFSAPEQINGICDLQLRDIAFLTCRGGWPDATFMDGDVALEQAFDYLEAIINSDISRADGVNRKEERTRLLLRSFARHQGSGATIRSFRNDMIINDMDKLDEETVASYINALKKIFVIEDMPAWNPNLRSKSAIRTSDTRYFVDPSIATAALGAGPDDLISDLNTFGLVFETLCVRDLRVFADALQGKVYHFRDSNGLECDSVVHLRNGSYGLVEIKLGGNELIEEGARTLKLLASKIDIDRMKSPSFMMVLTAIGPYAYRREDGVYVVPIGCLKP